MEAIESEVEEDERDEVEEDEVDKVQVEEEIGEVKLDDEKDKVATKPCVKKPSKKFQKLKNSEVEEIEGEDEVKDEVEKLSENGDSPNLEPEADIFKLVYLSQFKFNPLPGRTFDVKPQNKSSSSLYLHPKVKDEEKDTPMIKVLRTRISAKKASVEAFQRLVDNMRENGRNLKGEIVKAEKKIYKNVSHDLERGMSYVIGSQMRKNQHKLRIDAAKKEMESLQCDIDAQLQVLEEEIEVADKKFMEQDADLQELHTYKDKLYPTQLLQINKLTNELKNIDDLHKVDDMKLKRIINEEMSSLKQKQHISTSHNLDHIAHQTFINSRPNIIISLNKNNQILIKEINQQQKDIGELKKEIERLENENNKIKRSKTNDVRSVAFKHVFLQPDQKFGPDDDVIIDIPLPVVLPI